MEKQPAQTNVNYAKRLIEEKLGRELGNNELRVLAHLYIRHLIDTQRAARFGIIPGRTPTVGWALFNRDITVFSEFLDCIGFVDEDDNYGGPQGEEFEQYMKQHPRDEDEDNTKKSKNKRVE